MKFLGFKEKEKDKPLYRYMDFHRVVQMFIHKELVFIRPELWDDPFEQYLINSKIKYSDGRVLIHSLNNVVHGISWTSKMVSDAMWRIYSPHELGVRIKTNARLLSTAIDNALKINERSSSYIGKVKYLSQSKTLAQIEEYASKLDGDKKDEFIAQSLLIKRGSFSHEQEVRTVVIDRHSKSKNGILKLRVNPHEIVQSVLIDSRAPDEILEVYSKYLKETLGFKGRVTKSILYKSLDRLLIDKK